MQILRDSIWQFIGAVIAFMGLLAAVIFYLLQRISTTASSSQMRAS